MDKLILILLLFLSSQIFGQASATAVVNTRATVVDPIEIEKTVDLDFGNVISAYNAGQVVLSPDGSRVAYGVQLSNSLPGTVNPAEAVVTHGNNNYSITLPESFVLYNESDPNQVLIIDDFQVDPLKGELQDVLRIGATLNLHANQLSGYYTNSSGFNVTVSYN
ncbi:DUF4402 domain-containing protein [Salinimicrobium soli]